MSSICKIISPYIAVLIYEKVKFIKIESQRQVQKLIYFVYLERDKLYNGKTI